MAVNPRQPGSRMSVAAVLVAAGLVAVAVALRAFALTLPGHSGDIFVIGRWAEVLADVGPLGFFGRDSSIYPALLYLLWPIGVLLDGQALDLAIKGMSIPFDLAIGALLFGVVRGLAGVWPGLGAAALYLLNPAVLIAGPMWGQVDAAGTLLMLAALVAAGRSRHAAAGAFAVLAGLLKPQSGLVLLPVAVIAMRHWPRPRGLRDGWRSSPLLRAAVGGIVVFALVTVPLLLNPLQLVSNVAYNSGSQPFASVSAPNPWALLVGYRVPDGSLVIVGAVLLLGGLAAALLPLRQRLDPWTILAVGSFVVLAFYFLPTRIHERYLFPATALLAPFAVVSWRSLAAYVCLSVAFGMSLIASLATSMRSTIGTWPVAEALTSQAAVWAMGVALALAALAEVWLLLQLTGRFDLAVDNPTREHSGG